MPVILETKDFDAWRSMRRVYPEAVPLGANEQAKLNARQANFDELAENGEESPEVSAELDRLQAEIEALTEREQYSAEDIARAGAFISLRHNGEPRIERGFVRKEDDEDDSPTAESDAAKTDPDGAARAADGRIDAYRTAALRNALLLSARRSPCSPSCMRLCSALSIPATRLHACRPGSFMRRLRPTRRESTKALPVGDHRRHEAWERRLPPESEQLWQFLAALPDSERLTLMAHCVSLSVNALRVPGHPPRRSPWTPMRRRSRRP
jgi:ParB family transcriptional regulator, chromosome partitioning protein